MQSKDVTHSFCGHAPIDSYHEQTRLLFQPVFDELKEIDNEINIASTAEQINGIYRHVTAALKLNADTHTKTEKGFSSFGGHTI